MADPNAHHEPLGKRALANQNGTSYQQVKFDGKRVIRFIVLLNLVLLAVGFALQAPSSLFITVPLVTLIVLANRATRRSSVEHRGSDQP